MKMYKMDVNIKPIWTILRVETFKKKLVYPLIDCLPVQNLLDYMCILNIFFLQF